MIFDVQLCSTKGHPRFTLRRIAANSSSVCGSFTSSSQFGVRRNGQADRIDFSFAFPRFQRHDGSQELAVRRECRGRRAGRNADDIGEQCEASSPRRLDVLEERFGPDAVLRDRLFTLGTRRLEGGPSRGGSGVSSSGIPSKRGSQANHASPSHRGCQAKARANRKPVTNVRLTGCHGRLRTPSILRTLGTRPKAREAKAKGVAVAICTAPTAAKSGLAPLFYEKAEQSAGRVCGIW